MGCVGGAVMEQDPLHGDGAGEGEEEGEENFEDMEEVILPSGE